MLTQTYLHSRLKYFPETGEFLWLKIHQINKGTRVWNMRFPGTVAGNIKNNGYQRIIVNRKEYLAHRLAFLYMTGEFPPHEVDHINHDRSDNRWKNLRLSDRKDNCKNRAFDPRNTSGFTGVRWNKKMRRWVSQIGIDGKAIYLGSFHQIEEAISVRKKAEKKLGFHSNHGKSQ